jgi:xanthine dehydrogenase YagR molybdenum-binding subunit
MNERVTIGSPTNRIDGRAKVTGSARYAAEYDAPGLLHGVIVSSAIPKGLIKLIDVTAAKAVPGVVEVISHKNRPHIAWFDRNFHDDVAPPGSPFRAFYDDRIQFSAQPVALVAAETFEAARFAATIVDIQYDAEAFNTDFATAQAERFVPMRKRSGYTAHKDRGDAVKALGEADIKVAGEYHMPPHHHNPMEMHAATVFWKDDGSIVVHDKTQGPQNVQRYLMSAFGFAADQVQVLNPYVGGAFGSGLRPQYHVYLATLAAKMLKRSVRVVMTRQQMFSHAHRPEATQTVALGSGKDGKLTAISQTATTATSRFENYMETVVNWGMMNYACPNATSDYAVAPLDIYTPSDMRAPGAATGMTLFEMAMDELAYESGLDPLQLRLVNYSDKDAMNDSPFTSKALREAYQAAADKFGWSRRIAKPRSMRDGKDLVGWGMATGMWEALFNPTSASVTLTRDGRLEVSSATSDIGTGTYTIMAQIASDTLGVPIDRINVRLGDSSLPTAPVQGGSWAAASTGAAVQLAAQSLRRQLIQRAKQLDDDAFKNARDEDILFEDGAIRLRAANEMALSLAEVIARSELDELKVEETAKPGWRDMWSQIRKSRNTHSAIFAEVKVDAELGVVRVTRIVIAVAAGRIINPKTARSQILGGVVMGIGMALHEESLMDTRLGRYMNHSFAEYHVPTHADIEDIEVIFVDEPDPEVTPLGVKGVGEIGIVGTAAAVANAIFHATGKRVRSLPITIDKLL